jgi:hypothetical protein
MCWMLFIPWLHNVRVIHELGNNLITIEGNGIVHIIAITKYMHNNTKWQEVFLYYDFINEVINEEEDVVLETKPHLFVTNIITLLKLENLAVTIISLESNSDHLTFIFHIIPLATFW